MKREDLQFSKELTGDIKGMKFGVPEEYLAEGLDPEVKEAVLNAAKVLEEKGAVVEEFDLSLVEYAIPAYYVIACAEASSNLARFDGVKYGALTPAIDTPTRLGYTFQGWDPAVSPTVTGNAVYTAQWQPLPDVSLEYVAEGAGGSVIGKDGEPGQTATERVSPLSGEPHGAAAVPNAGYRFAGWFVDGQLVSDSAQLDRAVIDAAYAACWRRYLFLCAKVRQYPTPELVKAISKEQFLMQGLISYLPNCRNMKMTEKLSAARWAMMSAQSLCPIK